MYITPSNIHQFKQNDEIEFTMSNDVQNWKGVIEGVATTPQPAIGRQYIVRVTSGQIPNATHPFTHCVVFEAAILNHPNRTLESAVR